MLKALLVEHKVMYAGEKSKHWQELQEKVEFLKHPSSFPEKTGSVKSIETHLSWVFLTDEYAYKMKKPVQLPFVNFTKLEVRQQRLKTELYINTWLAPGIYHGLLTLFRTPKRHLHLSYENDNENRGEIIDYLLQMKRLPHQLMLDYQITQNTYSVQLIRQAAQRLAGFYQRSSHMKVTPAQYLKSLRAAIEESYQVLSAAKYGLASTLVTKVYKAQLNTLDTFKKLLAQRVNEERITDGHGDLKPEHICLTNPPVLIDRLEVEPADRQVDPIDELSYLYIECQLLGHPEIGDIFFETYREYCADNYPQQLLPFFKSLRACKRAKFSAWHLDDPQVKDKHKYALKTTAYFELSTVILD